MEEKTTNKLMSRFIHEKMETRIRLLLMLLTTNSVIIIDHITRYHSYSSWLLTLFLDKNLRYKISNGNLDLPHGSEQKTLCFTPNIKVFSPLTTSITIKLFTLQVWNIAQKVWVMSLVCALQY